MRDRSLTATRAKRTLERNGTTAVLKRTSATGVYDELTTIGAVIGRPRFATDTPLGDWEVILAHDVEPVAGDILEIANLVLILRVRPEVILLGSTVVIYLAWGFES
jgi:hypothetical protein